MVSCGASRKLRFISAKPGNFANVITASHSGRTSSSSGIREMTGPKNVTPCGGWNVMMGVPTSRPVRDSASSVSSSSSASHEVSSSERAHRLPEELDVVRDLGGRSVGHVRLMAPSTRITWPVV
jgi:hypothetical protein